MPSSLPFFSCPLLHLRLLFFHIVSCSIYRSLLSLPSVLHTFLHLSSSSYFPLWAPFSSRSYSSTSPSWFLLLSLFVFIPPSYSLAIHSYHFLCYPMFFFISIPSGPTWKHVGYISIYLFRRVCVCGVCVCVCTFCRQKSALVLPKWEIHFYFALYHLPQSHLEKCIYRRRSLCEH